MDQPNGFFLDALLHETQPHVILLGLAFVAALPLTWRRCGGWNLVILWYALFCLAVISFCVIPFNRYALPAVLLTYFIGGLGAAHLVQMLKGWPKALALGAALALFLGLQLPRCLNVVQQFRDDSRDRLFQWVVDNLPRNARIIADGYATLEHVRPDGSSLSRRRPDLQLSAYGTPYIFAPAYGPLELLRQRGVRYVIVCELNYGRYINPHTHGAPGEEDRFKYFQNWYLTLFRDYRMVWEAVPEYPTYSFTNPTIRVYDLTQKADPAPPGDG